MATRNHAIAVRRRNFGTPHPSIFSGFNGPTRKEAMTMTNLKTRLKECGEGLEAALERVRYLTRVKYLVGPPLALLLALAIINEYTALGITNGALFILVLSVWYTNWYTNTRLAKIRNDISSCQLLIELIVCHLRPEYRGMTIQRVERADGAVTSLTIHTADDPLGRAN